MKEYNINENFKIVVSTKNTLIGADTAKFSVYYAPIGDLTNTTSVSGGISEVVETIATGTEHTATTSASAKYGDTSISVSSGHNIVSGDVIEYATGLYAYVTKATSTKLYLRTPILQAVASGATLTQVGNTGVYETANIAIAGAGEYLVTIEAPEYGIMVEDRIRVVDNTVASATDPNAPVYSEIAIAY